MKTEAEKETTNDIRQYRFAGELNHARKILGAFAFEAFCHCGKGVVCVSETDLVRARRLRRFDQMVAQYIPLKDVQEGRFGDPSSVEMFSWLLDEADPLRDFVLIVTRPGQGIAEIFLVQQS